MTNDEEKAVIKSILAALDGLDVDEMMKMLECTKTSILLMCEKAGIEVSGYRPKTEKRMTLCRRFSFNGKDGGDFKCRHMMQVIDGGVYDIETAIDDGCTFGIEREHYRRKRK